MRLKDYCSWSTRQVEREGRWWLENECMKLRVKNESILLHSVGLVGRTQVLK